MIYFKKCGYSDTDNKVSHKKVLRAEAYKLLRSALLKRNVPDEEQELDYNEYGKPFLKKNCGWHFNISHCRKLAACAVAQSPIGVDVEKIRQFPELVLKRCFTDRETDFIKNSSEPDLAFFRLWTLKESYIKAIGRGLSYPLRDAEFIIENNHITANTEGDYSFAQIIFDKEFVCSVCCNNIFNNQTIYRSFSEEISFDLLK